MDAQQVRAREQAHAQRTSPWVHGRLARRAVGDKHPVDDFLFDYYPYSIAKLTTWHPGWGVIVDRDDDYLALHRDYTRVDTGVTLGIQGLRKRADRLNLAANLLQKTHDRAAQFGCFGMHEWAMVFRGQASDIRHPEYPLRLEPSEIERTVQEVGLRCTHIDAFRFFTVQALPLNEHQLTRATQEDFEQPGCVHAAMDLYKYAMWAGPYIPSELAADCFELARTSRVLDMQASPYDLQSLGLEAIAMETAAGRAEYVARQRALSTQAQGLRQRLCAALDELVLVATRPESCSGALLP
ncbi:MAG: 3-methyladenine DNA glycosylase [Actinomycetota bacterium]|nr:3-methyladenine DNA glycosylase [Actinomycetota bacterium]